MAASTENSWRQPADRLNEETLRALIDGVIPLIRIADFATTEECAAFCDGIKSQAAKADAAQTADMALIGANFSNHDGADKVSYFQRVERSYADVGEICLKAGFDPLARMLALLKKTWPEKVEIASEPGFGRYFAGGVKTRTQSGHLHYDFAPHTAEGYAIAAITDQLGWNLYLAMPEGTGHTTTFRRPIEREAGKSGSGPARALNLDPATIQGAEAFTFHPRIGEVAIINTRYPHDITVKNPAPDRWRAQTSSFIGRLPDDRLILWS